ncbi:MAG: hypothetical protein Q9216_004805 [Gyalolechia sp. 2 TL-2023]
MKVAEVGRIRNAISTPEDALSSGVEGRGTVTAAVSSRSETNLSCKARDDSWFLVSSRRIQWYTYSGYHRNASPSPASHLIAQADPTLNAPWGRACKVASLLRHLPLVLLPPPIPRLACSQVNAAAVRRGAFMGKLLGIGYPGCCPTLLLAAHVLTQTVDANASQFHHPDSWDGRWRIIPSFPSSPDDHETAMWWVRLFIYFYVLDFHSSPDESSLVFGGMFVNRLDRGCHKLSS